MRIASLPNVIRPQPIQKTRRLNPQPGPQLHALSFGAKKFPTESALAQKTKAVAKDMLGVYKVPGVSLLISTPAETAFVVGGVRNVPSQARVDGNTPFFIGSLTKPFVATAIFKLIEAGHFSLDTPISKLLPDEVMQLSTAKEAPTPIRVKDLLGHTSGLPECTIWPYFTQSYHRSLEKPPRPFALKECLGFCQQEQSPLPKVKGQYDYHDTNYELLGLIIEQCTGKPPADVMKELIFDPLQMTNSYFQYPHDPAEPVPDHIARNYTRLDPDQFLELPGAPLLDGTAWGIAAYKNRYSCGMLSTPRDMTKFLKALLKDKTLLKPESLEAMTNIASDVNDKVQCSLGLFRMTSGSNFFHNGRIVGTKSLACYVPRSQTTIVAMINGDSPRLKPLSGILTELLRKHQLSNLLT